jgi:spermidine synthase
MSAVTQRTLVLYAVGALGVSCVMTQLALMREALCAFYGNEMVLGAFLGNWLLLTGLGAWLGRRADRLQRPMWVLVWVQVMVAVLPLAQVFLLRALRNAVFPRGAMIGLTETVVASFILLLPYCLVSGYFLTLACAILSLRPGADRASSAIGSVYIADSVGSVVGGVIFSFVLVQWFDHFNLLYFPSLLNLALAGWAAFYCGKVPLTITSVLAAGLLCLSWLTNLDAWTTALQYPKQQIVARANSPYGRLVVTESGGQYNFIENGLPFISTHNLEQVEESVHYAMAQRPQAERVLLVSGGISGTAKEILKHQVREVTYVELDPLIIEVGRSFLPENLADPRIKTITTDGRLFIKRAEQRFDVVIVDVPNPSTSQINRFYTAEFFAEAKRRLTEDGVLAFSLGHYENYVSPDLARLLASANRTLKQSFANVLMIPGGRIFFLASDRPLYADIAARLEQQGVTTRLVNRHYLSAMLSPDRLADMQRATAQSADVNRDFSPVLYYYHLRYWMSQFALRFGLLEGGLLGLLIIYLFTLRPVPLAIFASGFAASALEIVLLLGIQILYGSLYHQVGAIVTMFMAGLAAGAFLVNRRLPNCAMGSPANPATDTDADSLMKTRRDMVRLAFAIAAYAGLLPLVLRLLGRLGSAGVSLGLVQIVIPLLTFILAVLVGMEFPLANRLEFKGASSTAARLYTADFVGACLGALLASTLLIPLLGVTAVCLITAGLNILGGVTVRCRRRKA